MLTVIIDGNKGEGKSTVAAIVADALSEYGYEVENDDKGSGSAKRKMSKRRFRDRMAVRICSVDRN